MQRLRITFARGEELKYISHLDLMRLWERALRRAALPLAYSEGYSPHPKISLAAPLAVGVTSQLELMDVFLQKRISPYFFIKTVSKQLPKGMEILEVAEVGLGLPSLQSQVRQAEYCLEVETEKGLEEVQSALRSLLAAKRLPWQHLRDGQLRQYDLRALVDDLWLVDWRERKCILGMRLRTDNEATGRPEQVTVALGFPDPPKSILRTKIILAHSEATPKASRFRTTRGGQGGY